MNKFFTVQFEKSLMHSTFGPLCGNLENIEKVMWQLQLALKVMRGLKSHMGIESWFVFVIADFGKMTS